MFKEKDRFSPFVIFALAAERMQFMEWLHWVAVTSARAYLMLLSESPQAQHDSSGASHITEVRGPEDSSGFFVEQDHDMNSM